MISRDNTHLKSDSSTPRNRYVVIGVALASTSGAAILAHTFGPLPMSFTVPFVVLPTTLLLVGAVLLGLGHDRSFQTFSGRLVVGGSMGIIATLVYDAIRPPLQWIFGFSYDPYRAISIFGELMTGLPSVDPTAQVVGWLYHFWNGATFGMIFTLVRPKGGIAGGVVWAMGLQGLMLLAYPTFLEARLDDPGFLVTGLVGHATWGLVLGGGVRWWAKRSGVLKNA